MSGRTSRWRFDVGAAVVAGSYTVASVLWIIISDHLVVMLAWGNVDTLQMLQRYKGLGFVITSGLAIWILVACLNARRRRVEAEKRQIEEMLHVAQRLEAFGSLAGSVVHDFNNLIQVIRVTVDLIALDADDPEALGRHHARIDEAVQQAGDMTRQLMLFMRSDPAAFATADLRDIVRAAEGVLRQAMGSRGELRVVTGSQPAVARYVRSQLEGTLLNLVVNARDALVPRRPGLVTVGVSIERLVRHRSIFRLEPVTGEFVVVTVEDNGSGIPREHLQRIFSPFFTTKPPGKGTGLGLTSALRVMQTHGGWLEVTSHVDRGTRFALYFPAVAEPVAAATGAAGQGSACGRGEPSLEQAAAGG